VVLVSEATHGTRRRRVKRVVEELHQRFGHRKPIPHDEPLDLLIETLLSHNTNDRNRDRAYDQLRHRYPTWDNVRRADVKSIAAAIREAGLANTKAPHIKRLLRWLHDTRGEMSLSFLHDIEDNAVIELLEPLSGIGLKTVAVLLAMGLGRDHCPVDTHVWRVAGRLGLVPSGLTRDGTYHALRPLIPRGVAGAFHLDLLSFGRTVCTARNPSCDACSFRRWCPRLKAIRNGA
jgi:endonuclease-3